MRAYASSVVSIKTTCILVAQTCIDGDHGDSIVIGKMGFDNNYNLNL